MRYSIPDKDTIPTVIVVEPSSYCMIVQYNTHMICPLHGIELANILRKALNS